MSKVDIAKAEIKDWLKRKLLPKKKVQYDEPPIEQKTFFPVKSTEKVESQKDRFGGVVVLNNKILLVNPTNNFGNYAWTFPKGGATKGESPEDAAVREVEEESGYICKVIQRIAGKFSGTTSDNNYFLMRPIKQGKHGWETAQVYWAEFEDAKEMIMETGLLGNIGGMRRDLQVLHAAFGKEIHPEELKEIEDQVDLIRKQRFARQAKEREEKLKEKLGDEGYYAFKTYQSKMRKQDDKRRAQLADETQRAFVIASKKKADLRAQRQEELLRFKLGDEGYEKFKQFTAEREAIEKQKWNTVKGSYVWGLPSSSKVAARCWRCNGTKIEKKGVLNACQDCGAQWLDKKPLHAGRPGKPKPEKWVQKTFNWPKEGK